ncbi:MAG: hypothetical protein ACP5PV_00610 [Methanothrix sp.]
MIDLQDGFALDVENDDIKNAGIVAAGYTQNPLLKSIQIVDSDDRFISSDNQFNIAVDRVLYCFKLDKPATQIKRIRIETNDGNILSLPWEGIPEAASNNIIMRLYGVKDQSISEPASQIPVKKYYGFEIKITNNMDQDLLLTSGDFRLLDQFDYGYDMNSDEFRLLPNESVRYTLRSSWMSPISRPEKLVFRPENLTMDLEGWY